MALPVTALVAIVVATVVMWVVMVLVADGSRARGTGGLLHDMVTRFMGLIVLAMGVQFALTGTRNFFS